MSWSLKDDSLGLMQWSQRYRGTVSNRMDLHLFPLDTDVFRCRCTNATHRFP